jgi:hypothetical protein
MSSGKTLQTQAALAEGGNQCLNISAALNRMMVVIDFHPVILRTAAALHRVHPP